MNTLILHALSRMHWLKPREQYNLACHFQDTSQFLQSRKEDIEAVLGRPWKGPWEPSQGLDLAEKSLGVWRRAGISWTCLGNPDYPILLRHIYDPPLVLYFRGDSTRLNSEPLAAVGTRRPGEDCRMAAFRLGSLLAKLDRPLVSGLAYGIDAAVHAGSVSRGGPCIAVLGSGVQYVSPMWNRRLAADILDRGGCLVGEYPPDQPANRLSFIRRNRIISGLCAATIIVEAPPGSGALYTLEFALEQGREVFLHPRGLSHPERGRALRRALEDGARLLPVEEGELATCLENIHVEL